LYEKTSPLPHDRGDVKCTFTRPGTPRACSLLFPLGNFLAVSETNAANSAILDKHFINNSVIDYLAAMAYHVVRKSLGKLLATALNIAIAGVIFLAVFLKRYSLIKGGLKVREHNSKALCLRGISAEICENSRIESSYFFGLKEMPCKLICVHTRKFLYLEKCQSKADFVN
jgi:hypothetical protein